MMVQRYLSARSQRQAATALVASGFVILAQFALFLFIGVSLWVFYGVFPPSGADDQLGRDVHLLHRPLLANRSARTGDRSDLLGGDGYTRRFA